jgi:hypothetical protein
VIEPQQLQNPEQDLALQKRPEEAPKRTAVRPIEGRPAPSAARVAELERELADAQKRLEVVNERIGRAREMKPPRDGFHCRDCFLRGRDAAMVVVLGDAEPVE